MSIPRPNRLQKTEDSGTIRGRGETEIGILNFGLRISDLKARIQNSGGKEQREWGQRTEDRKQMKLIAVSSHRLYYSQAL